MHILGRYLRSSHPVYGITCSGLTDNTKLSFTSSNSSFSECVRKHYSHRTFYSNNNPSCDPLKVISGRCIYHTTGPTLSGSGPFIFTDTDFIECKVTDSSSYGGAIDCTSGDLTIQRCSFIKCYVGYRGGAVSFRSDGLCIQEDNLYLQCSSGHASGAFDSFDPSKLPTHNHKRCRYIDTTSEHHAHFTIEYSTGALLYSNIYIHGRITLTSTSGTIVNYHEKGPIVYCNCLFADGNAYNGGVVSLLGVNSSPSASLEVKYCFFSNNHNSAGTTYEIYFDEYASPYASKELILHSFTCTSNSKVFVYNLSPQGQDWLPLGTLKYLIRRERNDYLSILQIVHNWRGCFLYRLTLLDYLYRIH